ncbi:MAG: PIN domain-containing protein [Thermomicrobiales bacterium]
MGRDHSGRAGAGVQGEIRLSYFVDTNIFVRLIAADDPEKESRTLDLFDRARSGAIDLMTSEAIIAETIYVLTSPRLYGATRSQAAESLLGLLSISALHLDHKDTVVAALQRYALSNFAFPDCLCIEHALRQTSGLVFTYDRGFDRVPDIRRLEP